MNTELDWAGQIRRVEALRQEAAQRHLAALALRTNIWARLLPPLRRLEGWMERRARTSGQGGAAWKTQTP